MIERSRDHTRPRPRGDFDLPCFLTADLSILGPPETDYWAYARQLRQQHRRVPDLLYRPGRRKVLSCWPSCWRCPRFATRPLWARGFTFGLTTTCKPSWLPGNAAGWSTRIN